MAKKHEEIKVATNKNAKQQLQDSLNIVRDEDYYKRKLPEFIIEIVDYLNVNSLSQYSSHVSEKIVQDWIDYYIQKNPNLDKDLFYSQLLKLINALSNTIINAYQLDKDNIIRQKKKEWEKEQVKKRQMIFTPKEVVAMSDIFGIKTENTVGKYLDKGIIRGKQINKKWQIPRDALIEYIGHDNF